MALVNLLEDAPPEGNLLQIGRRDQADAERIVDVVGVVGETVGGIGDLSLQQRLARRAELGDLHGVAPLTVQGHRFEYFPRQIQAGEIGIAIFEYLDNAQGM